MEYLLATPLDCTPGEVFRWHAGPGAMERLLPPWEKTELPDSVNVLEKGSRVRLKTCLGPIRAEWLVEHEAVDPGRGFTDIQVRGPFSRWRHEHRFEAREGGGCFLKDIIEFDPPFGAVGRLFAGNHIRDRLEAAFTWRHRITASDLLDHRESLLPHPSTIAVSGSAGLVGKSLVPYLRAGGHRVIRLVRSREEGRVAGTAFWSPGSGEIDRDALEGVDCVVHLAGENIAGGRWSRERKRRILESRTVSTRFLAETLAGLSSPPKALVSASAVGFYGDRGDEPLDERSDPGNGFLAEVCRAWEKACAPAAEAGIRVVNLRIGTVLTPAGGALRLMLVPFRLGLGGPFGNGGQYMSWVTVDDLVRAVYHVLGREDLSGPLNVTSPEPATNRGFSRALAGVVCRPAVLATPAPALRLFLGQMAVELLLSGQRVLPNRLLDSGFRFRYPRLETALLHLTGRLRRTHI